MRTTPDRSAEARRGPCRRRSAAAAAAAVVAVLAAGLTALGSQAAGADLAEQPSAATTFQISSFNLLGAGHTTPKGNKPKFASGPRRMGWAMRILDQGGVDVAGFQEFEKPQFTKFEALAGSDWDVFPGMKYGTAGLANSIAWRTDTWRLISASTVKVPYFHGKLRRMPLVLLSNVVTGQDAWFFNTHNPANARGPAQKWRDKAVAIEVAMVNRLRAQDPDLPVFVTGDMNDRSDFYCPMTAGTDLEAANGGANSDGLCTPPVPTRIDWIMASPQVTFTSYTAREDALVAKTTDHPVIMATASIPPLSMQGSGISRVVLLDVEGLSSRAVRKAGPTRAPTLYRMMSEGAATLNARTEAERTTMLPNFVSMLTGRRVYSAAGGHGVKADVDTGGTVAATAGQYVSSIFDLVHNFGRSTALFSSSDRMALVARSWDGAHGGVDPYGSDDGRAKISSVVSTRSDQGLVRRLDQQLTRHPKTLTVAHLSSLAAVGHERGWLRPAYFSALTQVDQQLDSVLTTISADPRLAASTLVILTADSGGVGSDSRDVTRQGNFKVPLVVWGPGVVAGADLYGLNPAYADPGALQVGYTGPQPIRNATVANLVTAVLGLPRIPGSQLNPAQDFNIFVGP